MQLPPQDFDLTVAFVASLIYVPMWLLMAASLFGAGAALVLLLLWIRHLFSKGVPLSSHRAASAMLLAVTLILAGTYFYDLRKHAYPAVRWIAHLSDFHKADLYPDMPKGVRIRLHENGVVSTASIEEGAVVIRVSTPTPRPDQGAIHEQ